MLLKPSTNFRLAFFFFYRCFFWIEDVPLSLSAFVLSVISQFKFEMTVFSKGLINELIVNRITTKTILDQTTADRSYQSLWIKLFEKCGHFQVHFVYSTRANTVAETIYFNVIERNLDSVWFYHVRWNLWTHTHEIYKLIILKCIAIAACNHNAP